MASYLAEMYGETVSHVKNRVSDWNMEDYSEILDFQCTTNFGLAKHGLAWA